MDLVAIDANILSVLQEFKSNEMVSCLYYASLFYDITEKDWCIEHRWE